MSEERLFSYLATATARPVKAKIEFPFTTGLSLDRKRQTAKKHNRDADNKTCISMQKSYATVVKEGRPLHLAILLGCLLRAQQKSIAFHLKELEKE